MRRFWLVTLGILAATLLSACAGAQSTPNKSAAVPAASTGIATATTGVAQPTATISSAAPPATTSVATAVAGVIKLEVSAGSPPAVGWKWQVMQHTTGPEDVAEGNSEHGYFWAFYVLRGSTEIGVAGTNTRIGLREATLIPARQEHTHRHPAQSEILGFQLRPGDRPPGDSHRGKLLFASDEALEVSSANYSVRVREYTLARGQQTTANVGAGPFSYVMEGTLSSRSGTGMNTTDAGKVLSLASSGTVVLSNEGTVPVTFVLVDVHQ